MTISESVRSVLEAIANSRVAVPDRTDIEEECGWIAVADAINSGHVVTWLTGLTLTPWSAAHIGVHIEERSAIVTALVIDEETGQERIVVENVPEPYWTTRSDNRPYRIPARWRCGESLLGDPMDRAHNEAHSALVAKEADEAERAVWLRDYESLESRFERAMKIAAARDANKKPEPAAKEDKQPERLYDTNGEPITLWGFPCYRWKRNTGGLLE
jgi:hypothetical protein